MIRALVIEPEAEAEIEESARWYEEQRPSLGRDFLEAVSEALEKILRGPLQYQIVHGEMRRARLRRFPHGLIYIVSHQEIVVLGCIHGRRDPKGWQERT